MAQNKINKIYSNKTHSFLQIITLLKHVKFFPSESTPSSQIKLKKNFSWIINLVLILIVEIKIRSRIRFENKDYFLF